MYKADLKSVATIYRPGTGSDGLCTLFLIIITWYTWQVLLTPFQSEEIKVQRGILNVQNPSEIKWQRLWSLKKISACTRPVPPVRPPVQPSFRLGAPFTETSPSRTYVTFLFNTTTGFHPNTLKSPYTALIFFNFLF